MSWSPDLFIGELRPWPDSVHVVRGKTDEVRRYMPERKDAQEVLTRRIDELCMENERLRQENRSIGMAAYELGRGSVADENAELREMIADMWRSAMMYCDFAERCAFADEFVDRMRELGVEVRDA